MSNLFLIVLVLIILGGLAYFVKKRFLTHTKLKNIHVVDPEAQTNYQANKQISEVKTLTLEEKVELSWQFLVNIKNQVLNKFSKSDQKQVHETGQKLSEGGMKYQHDIEQEVRITQETSKVKVVSQTKSAESIGR